MEPWCKFVYTQDELRSPKIQKYIKTHKYGSAKVQAYPFKLKKWKIDEILALKEGDGWTPRRFFKENGLKYECDIDLDEIFDGRKLKKRFENGKEYHYKEYFGPNWNHTLSEKKSEIEKRLDRIDYKNRELVIFRTSRRGFINWDSIGVFSIGRYHTSKEQIRKKLESKYEIELEKQKETIRKNKELYKNAPKINWKEVLGRLKKEAKKKPGEYIMIDPRSQTIYNMNSRNDRKKFYSDFSRKQNY